MNAEKALEVRKLVMGMSRADLKEVWGIVKAEWDVQARCAALAFRVGDRVKFKARDGTEVVGTVAKMGQKRLQVKSREAGFPMVWRVPPEMLTKVGREVAVTQEQESGVDEDGEKSYRGSGAV